ncbi:hypothetical protein [Wenjunlia tyrosinilytica]|uniref:tRNA nuclease CdiA C-terminal domain-containing protein n=1 Tax=Wenjunlia tyrosinilytica TaxID=1544741 RepID=A0A918DZ91_9ACTN|nr:hypothetical protein [Wenjunlia tyrosinilytica]GGO89365.1 hypothetical protein GCM10012280_32330 [Wenjunlia tyrosinilytica]
MIKPAEIPQFTGDLEQLERDVGDLRKDASAIRRTGADVHSGFQGLSVFYHAPESEQLFATTAPVRDVADEFAGDLEKVQGALSDYASQVRPIADRLERLRLEAAQFVESVRDDDDWEYDGDKVAEHNDLQHDVNAAVAAFWEAERTAANKITAVFGGTRYVVGDGSGRPETYGYTAGDLDHAKVPWGTPEEEGHHFYDVGHWIKGFVWDGLILDGVWGTVRGLGAVLGFSGWDDMQAAWNGLGMLAVGVTLYRMPGGMAVPDSALPAWMRDCRKVARDTGKALVAWDEWGKNPARAAGAVTFNALTAATGAGSAGKAGTAAKVAGAAGRVGRAIDPMAYVVKAGGKAGDRIPRVGEVMAGLRKLDSGTVAELPNGAVRLPNDAILHADGTLKLPDGRPKAPPIPREPAASNLPHAHEPPAQKAPTAVHTGPGSAERVAHGVDNLPRAGHDAHGPGRHPGDGATGHVADCQPRKKHELPGTRDHSAGSHVEGHGAVGDGAKASMHSVDDSSGVYDAEPRRPVQGAHDSGYRFPDGPKPQASGGMRPDQEVHVASELDRMRLSATDQDRLLGRLRRSSIGERAADLISRGHLSGVRNYDEVLKMFKQKGIDPAATMALEHATELQARGFHDLAFEIKNETGLDLDVATLKPDGTPDFGYQLKDVSNLEGIKSAAKKAAKQLAGHGVAHKVAVLDVRQSMDGFVDEYLKDVEFYATKSNATFHLRFSDGAIIIPERGQIFP